MSGHDLRAADRSGTVLIAGALGIVGRAALDRFTRDGDWDVIGLSRRTPDFETSASFVSADLRDADASASALRPLSRVTHVVYAALYEQPSLVAGWRHREQMETNLAMLRNLLDGLEAAGAPLRHLTLLQGTKAYGHHIERFADWERDMRRDLTALLVSDPATLPLLATGFIDDAVNALSSDAEETHEPHGAVPPARADTPSA